MLTSRGHRLVTVTGIIQLSNGEEISVPLKCAEECQSLERFLDEERDGNLSDLEREIARGIIKGISQNALDQKCPGPRDNNVDFLAQPPYLTRQDTKLCNVTLEPGFSDDSR